MLISKINSVPSYIKNNLDKVNDMIERLNEELDYYAQLEVDLEIISNPSYDFSEIRRNLEKNYRTLSLIYYKFIFKQNEIQSQQSEKN